MLTITIGILHRVFPHLMQINTFKIRQWEMGLKHIYPTPVRWKVMSCCFSHRYMIMVLYSRPCRWEQKWEQKAPWDHFPVSGHPEEGTGPKNRAFARDIGSKTERTEIWKQSADWASRVQQDRRLVHQVLMPTLRTPAGRMWISANEKKRRNGQPATVLSSTFVSHYFFITVALMLWSAHNSLGLARGGVSSRHKLTAVRWWVHSTSLLTIPGTCSRKSSSHHAESNSSLITCAGFPPQNE